MQLNVPLKLFSVLNLFFSTFIQQFYFASGGINKKKRKNYLLEI